MEQVTPKYHYLKEHRMVGESLRYVAKLNGKWIALAGLVQRRFPPPCARRLDWLDGFLRKSRRPLVACNARFVLLGAK